MRSPAPALLGLVAASVVGWGAAASAEPAGFASTVLVAALPFEVPPCGEGFVSFSGTVGRKGWDSYVVESADGDWIKFVETSDTDVYGGRTAWDELTAGDRVTICYRAYDSAHAAGAFRSRDRRARKVYVTALAP